MGPSNLAARLAIMLPEKRQYTLQALPAHLIAGGMWAELEQLLTDLPFLEAKAGAGLVFALAEDLAETIKHMPAHRPQHRVLRLLEEAMRRDVHFISHHPQTLFQCLWNSCWWHDCPAADGYYDLPEGSRTSEEPPWRRPGYKLHELMESWQRQKMITMPNASWCQRVTKESSGSRYFWVRSLRPPNLAVGSPQLLVLRGHDELVHCVSFSPDGSRICSGAGETMGRSRDNTIRIWDAGTGAEIAVLSGHTGAVNCVSFSPDGHTIASGSNDRSIRLWDAVNLVELGIVGKHEGGVITVGFSPDGYHIISGSYDKTVRVWDANTAVEAAVFRGHSGWVRSLSISPDGARCISGSNDGSIRVWDLRRGTETMVIRAKFGDVESVCLAPAGHLIAGSDGFSVRTWDATTGNEVAVLEPAPDERGRIVSPQYSSVRFSSDSRRLVVGSYQGTSSILDSESLCFARKVCRFAMKGLPLGFHETTSGFWKRFTGRDERVTSYYPYVIMRPVIFQKHSIVIKVCREKSVWRPKIKKTPRNFTPFLTARVCFRCAITAKLSDNVRPTGGRRARPSAGAAMLCSLCIAGS